MRLNSTEFDFIHITIPFISNSSFINNILDYAYDIWWKYCYNILNYADFIAAVIQFNLGLIPVWRENQTKTRLNELTDAAIEI